MRIKTNLLLAFMTLATLSQAQWTTEMDINTEIVATSPTDLFSITDSQGGTYSVFWKSVGGDVNLELRMQYTDAAGFPQHGEEGILVSNEIPMSTFTMVSSINLDADDNIYLGVTASMGYSGYIFKIDAQGNHLWESPITFDDGYIPNVTPLDNGDIIVSWGSGQTMLQRFSSEGTAIWADPVAISLSSGNNAPGGVFPLSDGTIMLILHKYNFGVNSTMYAYKIDSDGAPIWDNEVQISNVQTSWNRRYSTLVDEDKVYIGYSAAQNSRFDGFLQCIEPDGTLPWGMNGTDFDVAQISYEMDVQIATEEGSDHVWANCVYTDNTQFYYGERVQKFSKADGSRLLGDNAKSVFNVLNNNIAHVGQLTLSNDKPLFVVKVGFDNGASPVNIEAVYLDENGDFLWEEQTKPLATYEASKSRIYFSPQVNQQSVLIFKEDRGNGEKIYAQNLTDINLSDGQDIIEDLNLSFQNPILDDFRMVSGERLESITVYDVLGKMVYDNQRVDLNTVSINTSNWNSGLYIMSVKTKEGQSKGIKLVKQ